MNLKFCHRKTNVLFRFRRNKLCISRLNTRPSNIVLWKYFTDTRRERLSSVRSPPADAIHVPYKRLVYSTGTQNRWQQIQRWRRAADRVNKRRDFAHKSPRLFPQENDVTTVDGAFLEKLNEVGAFKIRFQQE